MLPFEYHQGRPGLLNNVKPVRVARYIHSGVQDGKDLLDAHFVHALAHVLVGLRQLRSNRTEKIATAPRRS